MHGERRRGVPPRRPGGAAGAAERACHPRPPHRAEGPRLRASADWPRDLADPEGGTLLCHNDVCPENVVFRDGRATAFIDAN
ncbi:phosphotransferase [Streptomyces himalayensis]|uniref:Phosphotransferase n=1 Tax=Streptomyces himalayensis subsp. himalayensis TaxID=2756131 RepID=A0A7W0DMH6_9ACTN|nr:phosphotransferase [Streptomyces himalayensis subsp. himalayensis]